MPAKGVHVQKKQAYMYGPLWFGAAISLAEILAGTYFASLGLERGILAIVVGHVIGGILFGAMAYIGAKTKRRAMDSVKISFGTKGSLIFSVANIVQLIGWTAIMIVSGAAAATYLVPVVGQAAWCVIITVLIIVWIALGFKNMSRVQAFAALLLFALTVIVSFTVFTPTGSGLQPLAGHAISFGGAVELAVAMPLSWLPVVSDYTRHAERPLATTAMSTLGYFIGSCWMFIIGLGLVLFAGSSDIASLLASVGLGVAGILIVVFSTVTTTFLDAESVGHSLKCIASKVNATYAGIGAALIGLVLALFAPVLDFEGFLYLIGSVFAPMAAILFVDFFILRSDTSRDSFNITNLVLWIVGFALYRTSLSWDFVLGNTLPVMVIIGIASFIVHTIQNRMKSGKEQRSAKETRS